MRDPCETGGLREVSGRPARPRRRHSRARRSSDPPPTPPSGVVAVALFTRRPGAHSGATPTS